MPLPTVHRYSVPDAAGVNVNHTDDGEVPTTVAAGSGSNDSTVHPTVVAATTVLP